MNGFDPIINLLLFLTTLSVAAERLTNVLKLRNPQLRSEKPTKAGEKEREELITTRAVLVGIAVALALKADLLAVMRRLDAPWETIGWMQWHESMWVWAPETHDLLTLVYALLGSVVTGTALGFGSKFWHEVLDGVLELRNMAKLKNQRTRTRMPSNSQVEEEEPS